MCKRRGGTEKKPEEEMVYNTCRDILDQFPHTPPQATCIGLTCGATLKRKGLTPTELVPTQHQTWMWGPNVCTFNSLILNTTESRA